MGIKSAQPVSKENDAKGPSRPEGSSLANGPQSRASTAFLLGLHRRHGNRFAQRLLDGAWIQRKRVSDTETAGAPPIVGEILRSPGQPLDPTTRAFMERHFRRDFSEVRVHTDARAAESVRAIGALAYTAGRDVFFGTGQHAPHTTEGRRLMAHELAHVVQQKGAPVRSPNLVGPEQDECEREAESVAGGIDQEPWRGPHQIEPVASFANEPSALVSRNAGQAMVQRALPVLAEAGEIALTGAIVLQEQVAVTQHKLHVRSDTASRFLSQDPKPEADHHENVLSIGFSRGFQELFASFTVHWEGNRHGDIGAAYVSVDSDHTEFLLSSLDVTFRALENLYKTGADPLAWPMQWMYEGNFDPLDLGEWEFSGKFEIDAAGRFKSLEHRVVDRSLISSGAESPVSPGQPVRGGSIRGPMQRSRPKTTKRATKKS